MIADHGPRLPAALVPHDVLNRAESVRHVRRFGIRHQRVGGVRETRVGQGATCRAVCRRGSGSRGRGAGASELGEHLGDGGRGGDDRAYGEPSAATDADAKLDVEVALQEATPIEPRARGVELAVEQAIPVGERQDVRRDELGDPGRRQGPCRDEHEGRAPIARFERLERTRSRRRGRERARKARDVGRFAKGLSSHAGGNRVLRLPVDERPPKGAPRRTRFSCRSPWRHGDMHVGRRGSRPLPPRRAFATIARGTLGCALTRRTRR